MRVAAKLWWMIHKDLVSEYRGRQFWPATVLLGVVVVLFFALQTNLPPGQKNQLVSAFLWLSIFFAGTVALDRSFGIERDEACLESLLLYPVSPSLIYLSKLIVNVLVLSSLECVLIPLVVAFTDAPLLDRPTPILFIAVLGNFGLAAIGTLLSAVTSGTRQRGNLLALLVLPMAFPVILGASEATRLTLMANFGSDWWRWLQLLGAFAIIFVTAGSVLFDLVIEE